MVDETITKRPLSKTVGKGGYITTYTPALLNAIPRRQQRSSLGIAEKNLPFQGADIWHAYEFSWLNLKGKPEVSLAQFQVPAESNHIIESKSLKHYLGSYSYTKFAQPSDVMATLAADLTQVAGAPVQVSLVSAERTLQHGLGVLMGRSLDSLDIRVDQYTWHPDSLIIDHDSVVCEAVHTHLFRSLCPITGQPDFASILIQYDGQRITHEGLLKYLISYRQHAEYSEQIVERIFIDIMTRCHPERLTVQAKFTRRGGIDINPYRSHATQPTAHVADLRVWRQ